MLVLSRKAGETIVIAGKIRVHVVGLRGRSVRLGFEAAEDIAIEREELIERRLAVKAVADCIEAEEPEGRSVGTAINDNGKKSSNQLRTRLRKSLLTASSRSGAFTP